MIDLCRRWGTAQNFHEEKGGIFYFSPAKGERIKLSNSWADLYEKYRSEILRWGRRITGQHLSPDRLALLLKNVEFWRDLPGATECAGNRNSDALIRRAGKLTRKNPPDLGIIAALIGEHTIRIDNQFVGVRYLYQPARLRIDTVVNIADLSFRVRADTTVLIQWSVPNLTLYRYHVYTRGVMLGTAQLNPPPNNKPQPINLETAAAGIADLFHSIEPFTVSIPSRLPRRWPVQRPEFRVSECPDYLLSALDAQCADVLDDNFYFPFSYQER